MEEPVVQPIGVSVFVAGTGLTYVQYFEFAVKNKVHVPLGPSVQSATEPIQSSQEPNTP
jgi:hypothetical protein